jgi:hypothetical protein
MPGFTKSAITITNPVWLADFTENHLLRAPARLDATAWGATDSVVVTPSGTAARGATSVSVTALTGAIPSGTMLNFGTYAPVTVTLADASVSAGDTTITVSALSGPIPAEVVLDFSAGTNAQLAKLSANAAAGATTLTVYPLDGTIANTQTALFSGGTKQARLTAAAAAAATTLTVDELQFALTTADSATYAGSGSKVKSVPSGTLVGRTLAEQAASAPFGPAADTDIPPLGEVYFLYHDVPDLDLTDWVTLIKPGTTIKYNKLPYAYASLSANMLAYLREHFRMILGAA